MVGRRAVRLYLREAVNSVPVGAPFMASARSQVFEATSVRNADDTQS